MRNIRVGLVHINHPRHLQSRMVGWWSHKVPGLSWVHIPIGKKFLLDLDAIRDTGLDVAILEDAKVRGTTEGDGVPLVYHVVDSTLSAEHYQNRLEQSRCADLVLVDWDQLCRFSDETRPVRRWAYCVNTSLFKPYPKVVDVGFYCNPSPFRQQVGDYLETFCAQHGLTFARGRRHQMADYAQAIGETRINVNVHRNPETRSHRVFDVMASRSALLTTPHHPVSGDNIEAGVEYLTWTTVEELGACIQYLLEKDRWALFAERAYQKVLQEHTWDVRAAQLIAMLRDVFPGLGD